MEARQETFFTDLDAQIRPSFIATGDPEAQINYLLESAIGPLRALNQLLRQAFAGDFIMDISLAQMGNIFYLRINTYKFGFDHDDWSLIFPSGPEQEQGITELFVDAFNIDQTLKNAIGVNLFRSFQILDILFNVRGMDRITNRFTGYRFASKGDILDLSLLYPLEERFAFDVKGKNYLPKYRKFFI